MADVSIRVTGGSGYKVSVDPWILEASPTPANPNPTVSWDCNVPFMIQFEDQNTLQAVAAPNKKGQKLASLGASYGSQVGGKYYVEAQVATNAQGGLYKYTIHAVPKGNVILTIDPDYRVNR